MPSKPPLSSQNPPTALTTLASLIEAIRARRRLRLTLIAIGLIAVGGCAALGLKHPATAPQPLPTIDKPTPIPRASARANGATLTDEQARAALLTQTDLGAPWTATQGAATWRDGLLKATSTAAACGRLMETLYTDELLGGPPRAAIALDDADNNAQLRYQIGARRPADVDATLAWLKTLPAQCARFTANTDNGLVEDVRVNAAPLPEVGDARQGLHITIATTTSDGQGHLLTLDLAAVRVGQDAFAFTNAGLGDVPNNATQAAVQVGALRLADVRRQGRAQV